MEPKGQLLLIDEKTKDEIYGSLKKVLLIMQITTSDPKVLLMQLSVSNQYQDPVIGELR